MKPISQIIFLACMMFAGVSCSQPNTELIVGSWKVKSLEYFDKSVVSADDIANLEEETDFDGLDRFVFSENKRLYIYRGSVQKSKNDHFEYRITNEDLMKGCDLDDPDDHLPDNCNFYNPKETPMGHIIQFVMFEDDGELYMGGNIFGPFEILELTKNTLRVRNWEGKYHDEDNSLERNNIVINFVRAD